MAKKTPGPVEYYVVRRPDTHELVEWLSNEGCMPWAGGDYLGHCGGCDKCMLQQARHYGLEVTRLVPGPGETLGDALGLLKREWDAQQDRRPHTGWDFVDESQDSSWMDDLLAG